MISRKRIIRISDKVTIPILKAALTSNRPMLYSPVSSPLNSFKICDTLLW